MEKTLNFRQNELGFRKQSQRAWRVTSEVLSTFTFLGWLTAHNSLRGVAGRPQVWKLSLRKAAAYPRSHHAPLKPRFKGKSVHFHLAFHPSGSILFMDETTGVKYIYTRRYGEFCLLFFYFFCFFFLLNIYIYKYVNKALV